MGRQRGSWDATETVIDLQLAWLLDVAESRFYEELLCLILSRVSYPYARLGQFSSSRLLREVRRSRPTLRSSVIQSPLLRWEPFSRADLFRRTLSITSRTRFWPR